ncbi:antibiotic biosynthesis monooxygenase [Candidatus Symbiopectobacterium sp. NZEC127]|uniref:putative quinol monooxygenase n=1 Tax=Candidatus Symbiopectobacterium sp. NZEC127 TaxID=2820472 RepID=UPI002227847D|nr:putative quinol monooxygenase [Candidatus Symbiopectobacterium sp. NZEC127]MCW2485545.1 antibiotic biosynthesis monooxygenase [Candidatus Symbiopectobacterium sp. NZEC127]
MELRIVATIQAKPEHVDAVAQAVKKVVAPSRAEAGNLQYDLHESLEAPGTFVFFERWASRDVLTEHEATPHFQQLVAELEGKTLGMVITPLRALV